MLKMYEMRVFCVCGCIAVLFRSVRSRTLLCEWIGIFADVSERVENMFKWRLFGKIVLFYACLLCCFSFILSCLWLDPKQLNITQNPQNCFEQSFESAKIMNSFFFSFFLLSFFFVYAGVIQKLHICHVNHMKNWHPIQIMAATN